MILYSDHIRSDLASDA